MKVILLESITSVGKLGDVINVRPGYARNYLLPQGKAERASTESIEKFESRRAKLQQQQQQRETAMMEAQAQLDGYLLQLTARASPDGNLYGSITPQMIVAALNAQQLMPGLVIKRGQITLPDGQIKSLGEHNVSVQLAPSVAASFRVSVLMEAATSSPSHALQGDKL